MSVLDSLNAIDMAVSSQDSRTTDNLLHAGKAVDIDLHRSVSTFLGLTLAGMQTCSDSGR